MRLKQTYLDYVPNIVGAVDSAFTSGAKPQGFAKLILRSGCGISDGY